MSSGASKAYEAASKSASCNRELEANALFKSARQLEACQQNWTEQGLLARLRAALRHNQHLWTLFQTELERPDHELPADIRANLLRLSVFVDRRTYDLLVRPSPEKLQALIDVNRNIATGLAQRKENDPATR